MIFEPETMRLGNISLSRNCIRDAFPKAFFKCGLGLTSFTHIVFPIVQLHQEARHCIPDNLESLVCVVILKHSYDF